MQIKKKMNINFNIYHFAIIIVCLIAFNRQNIFFQIFQIFPSFWKILKNFPIISDFFPKISGI